VRDVKRQHLPGVRYSSYLVQHQMMRANPTRWADSIEEARAAAELIWGAHCIGVRQEISDKEPGERWFGADGASGWQHFALAVLQVIGTLKADGGGVPASFGTLGSRLDKIGIKVTG
jgi:hypothetical protein